MDETQNIAVCIIRLCAQHNSDILENITWGGTLSTHQQHSMYRTATFSARYWSGIRTRRNPSAVDIWSEASSCSSFSADSPGWASGTRWIGNKLWVMLLAGYCSIGSAKHKTVQSSRPSGWTRISIDFSDVIGKPTKYLESLIRCVHGDAGRQDVEIPFAYPRDLCDKNTEWMY